DEYRQPQASRLEDDDTEVDAMGNEHDRKRDRQEIDRKRPEHIEDARQDGIRDAAKKAGDEADKGGDEERDDGGGSRDQERVASAIEQPDHDIAALIVGAEKIAAELPGRTNGRVAQS